jgi:uncharacterized protein (DUF302 family)
MTTALAFEVRLSQPFDKAVDRVTGELRKEGFGILTRIDVHITLREKIGVAFRPYTILGACHPPLAHRALSHRAEAGLLLPCNVTVEAAPDGRGSVVRIGDPDVMLAVGGLNAEPPLRAVAAEARERLARVAGALRQSA